MLAQNLTKEAPRTCLAQNRGPKAFCLITFYRMKLQNLKIITLSLLTIKATLTKNLSLISLHRVNAPATTAHP